MSFRILGKTSFLILWKSHTNRNFFLKKSFLDDTKGHNSGRPQDVFPRAFRMICIYLEKCNRSFCGSSFLKRKKKNMSWVACVLVVVVGGVLWCGGGVEGKRPELVDSSVWFSPNATLLNVNFDLAVVQMVCCVVIWLIVCGVDHFLTFLLFFFFFFFFLCFSFLFFSFFFLFFSFLFFTLLFFLFFAFVPFFQDFDQPLYTNGHSFLCAESDVPCPPLDCKPCNWSGQEVCLFPLLFFLSFSFFSFFPSLSSLFAS